ncbi:MAG: HAMP domain-containing histidine kinase [Anaerolineales bacterium]|nr:HAMP domain-containing histidine kinase [Anaerolineales bacterium]
MSLRARLTLLYSSLVMGVLLVFGSAVYLLVSILLINHIDDQLEATVKDIVNVTWVNPVGDINLISFPPLDMTANIYVQIWGRNGRLMTSSPSLAQVNESLDPENLRTSQPAYHETRFQGVHLRVLNVPLIIDNRPVGTLQAATSLDVVDTAREVLLYIMGFATVIAVLLAAYGSWLAVGRALAPLDTITETTEQINRADDLARRIPYDGPMHDEIGGLIEAFNQTLERLETLFTSQQRFLADVSHELRTPLTVIKGNVDLMRRMKSLDEESLTSIDQEAGRLTRLVGGLLLLAQAESGSVSLNMKPVELDTLLLEVFQEMKVLAGEKIELHLTEIDQIQVNGDRDRLKQVLLNLVGNAIQYTPQGGDVFLSLGIVAEQARLIIRDTGPGIPVEDLPHIFERFYRAEKSRTRGKTTGFGLGLSIAHWIVDKHGGRIEVDSKDGRGTTFCIWLPLISHQPSMVSVQQV